MEQISKELMPGVVVQPLKVLRAEAGNVMHVLKHSDNIMDSFGEVYVSTIHHSSIKGWKKHKKMISNLVVPQGAVSFVFYDDRADSPTNGQFREVTLSPSDYNRVTVYPGVWMAFKGLGLGESIVINCASIEHDPNEADSEPIEESKIIPKYQF